MIDTKTSKPKSGERSHEASLGEVHLSGVDPYDFTARFLAWSAVRALEGVYGTGALGPVEAFGLEALQAGCAEAGIVRVSG